MQQSLIGRARELDHCLTLLAQTGSRGVVLKGEAGIGKSELARALYGRCLDMGRPARWVGTSSSMRALPFGALAGLLPRGFLSASGNVGLDTLVALRDTIRELAAPDATPVLFLDDLHNVDDASAGVLMQAADAEELCVVATLRDGLAAPDALLGLWKSSGFEVVRLGGLGTAELSELVRAFLPDGFDAAATDVLFERTKGNPLYARELLQVAAGRSTAPTDLSQLLASIEPGERLVDLVLSRVQTLPEGALELLELVSLADPLDLAIAHAAAPPGLDVDTTLRMLVRERLLREVERENRLSYTFDHPIQSEIVRRTTPAPSRRAGQRRIADALETRGLDRDEDVIRYANLRMESGEPADPAVAAKAARLASAYFDPALGVRLATAAGDAPEALLALAEAEHRQGNYQACSRVLGRLASLGDQPAELVVARVTLEIYNTFWGLGDEDKAFAHCDNAVADPNLSDEHKISLQALRHLMQTFGGRPRAVLEALRDVDLSRAEHAAFTPAYLFSMVATGHAETALGLVRPLLDDPHGTEHPVSVPWPHGVVAQVGISLGWLADDVCSQVTLPVIEQLYRLARRYAEDAALAAAGSMLGNYYFERGRLNLSADHWREGAERLGRQDWIGIRPWTAAGLALTLIHRGEVEEARAILAAIEPPRPNQMWYTYLVPVARAWLLHTDGRLAAAEQLLLQHVDHLEQRGYVYFASVAAFQLIRLNARAGVAGRCRALADAAEGGRVQLVARHAEAWEARKGPALEACAEAHARAGFPLYAAEAYAQAASLFREAGMPAGDARCSRLAQELAARCDDPRTPALALRATSALDGLTRAERQVAALAARGMSSPAIAKELVVSTRTVDSHLGRIYSKLGISGRKDLAEMLVAFS